MIRTIKNIISGDFLLTKTGMLWFSIFAVVIFDIMSVFVWISTIQIADYTILPPIIPLLFLDIYVNRDILRAIKEYRAENK